MRQRSSRGITMIEICLALVIASVLLAIGIPRFIQNRSNQLLAATAQQMAADLKQGRTVAMTTAPTTVAVVATGTPPSKIPPSTFKPAEPGKTTSNNHSSTITQYAVVEADVSGNEQTVRGPYPIDSSIQATMTGGSGMGSGTGLSFTSNSLYFTPTGGTTSSVVVLSNNVNQWSITVSASGEVTYTQEPLGTTH